MRLPASLLLAALALAPGPARSADVAADLGRLAPAGRYRATCEDLARFCSAESCGRDQIEAAQTCRALCPSAVVLDVTPARCSTPDPAPMLVLRRRG